VWRGLAVGDVDDDGAPDLLLASGDGRVRVYRNTVPRRGRWIGFRALDGAGRVDALGARIVVRAAGRAFAREVAPASSYIASHDVRVLVGLGEADAVEDVSVRWPGGVEESYGPLSLGQYHDLLRGRGR
jgi:hypothetical protein